MNKKGFTLVEVLVSFTLISVISIFLFQLVFMLRNIYIDKSIKTELALSQANISNVINKELYNAIENSNLKTIKINSDNSITFFLKDNSAKNLSVDLNAKQVSYGNYTENYLSKINLSNLEYDFFSDNTLQNDTLFYIKISALYPSLEEDYGFNVVLRFDSSNVNIVVGG